MTVNDTTFKYVATPTDTVNTIAASLTAQAVSAGLTATNPGAPSAVVQITGVSTVSKTNYDSAINSRFWYCLQS